MLLQHISLSKADFMWQHPQCTHHQATVMKQNHIYSVFYKDNKNLLSQLSLL